MAAASVVAHSLRRAISSMPAFMNSRDSPELFPGGAEEAESAAVLGDAAAAANIIRIS